MTKPKSFSHKVSERTQRVKQKQLKKEEDSQLDYFANQNLIIDTIRNCIPAFHVRAKDFDDILGTATNPDILVVHLSDVHIGKKSKSYDFQVFQNRLEQIHQHVLNELEMKQIRNLVLVLNGDICDGDSIYPGHSNHIVMKAAEQALIGAKCLSDMVASLARHFASIRVLCTAGNHGRPGKKGEESLSQNWDYILYKVMEVHLQSIKSIQFEIAEDWYHICSVGDLNLFILHGDDVFPGNPLGNLPRSVVSWGDFFHRWAHKDFDVVLSGHWHLPTFTEVNGRILNINGSFPGPDDYTQKKIKGYSKPSQSMFIIRDKEVVDKNFIVLE